MEKDKKILNLPSVGGISSLTITRGPYNGDYVGNYDGDVINKTIDGIPIRKGIPILNFMRPLIDISLNTIASDEIESPNITFNFDGCDVSDPLKHKIGNTLEDETKEVVKSILELTGVSMRLVPPVYHTNTIPVDMWLHMSHLSKKLKKHSCFKRCYKADKVFKTYPGLKDVLFNNCVGIDGSDYAKMLHTVELEMKINLANICDNIFDFLRRTAKNFFADKNINIIIKEYIFIKLKNWLDSYYKDKCYYLAIDETTISSVMLQRSMEYDYRKLHKLLGVIRELRNVE